MAPVAALALRLGCCYLSLPSAPEHRKQAKNIYSNHQLAPIDISHDLIGENTGNRINSWYDMGREPVELAHRAFVDPLPDIGDGDIIPGAHPDRPLQDMQAAHLVRYASRAFPHHLPTKNRASKALKAGNLLLNSIPNVEGCRHVHHGDVLTLRTDPPSPLSEKDLVKRTNFVRHMLSSGLSVAYEDDSLAAVYKPAGVHTKRGTNYRYLSLEDALPAILAPPSTESVLDGLHLPLAVHRLDVRVCGLVLVAKRRSVMLSLGEQFERREVKKRYKAMVVGRPRQTEDIIRIDAPIKVEGRGTLPARTTLKVMSTTPHAHWGALSYVELRPETGRTHQLRVHCAGIGCPIVGDDLYWDYAVQARRESEKGGRPSGLPLGDLPPVRRGGGLYLQSTSAAFAHPTTGEALELEVPVADKFERLQDKARKACEYDDRFGGGEEVACFPTTNY